MAQSDGSVQVKFENVSQVEARMSAIVKKLTDRLHRLEQELNPIQQHWTGDARTAYAADQKKWDQAASEMNLVLNDMKQAVGRAHETYVKVNQATRNLFNG